MSRSAHPARRLGPFKYDALEAMEARGAIAPVINDFACTWSGDTVADVVVHAECSDGEGHDCDATLELKGRD